MGHVAFDAALEALPHEYLTLRNGSDGDQEASTKRITIIQSRSEEIS